MTTTANHRAALRILYAAVALGLATAGAPQTAALPQAAASPASCLPGERGFLRASLRGAIDAELDWRGGALQCEGGARPDGRGLRVSFLGPADERGRRLRIVFGIAVPPGAARSGSAGTNVTVIFEGENRVYATRGDERCAIDKLVQEPLAGDDAAAGHSYRVAARGYCVDPASLVNGGGHLYINRFDFAGIARFEDNELHADTST